MFLLLIHLNFLFCLLASLFSYLSPYLSLYFLSTLLLHLPCSPVLLFLFLPLLILVIRRVFVSSFLFLSFFLSFSFFASIGYIIIL